MELFQIWLNLPRSDKLVEPAFSMFWSEVIPRHVARDPSGRTTEVTLVAGKYGELSALAPPRNSWAARPDSDLAIWTIKMAPGAQWMLPPSSREANRSLYFFRGDGLRVGDYSLPPHHQVQLRAHRGVTLTSGSQETELLLLQGRPINEPVVQQGPFVMSSHAEIRQALLDFQRTRFGTWRWQSEAPVHPREETRFAQYMDGRVERPG